MWISVQSGKVVLGQTSATVQCVVLGAGAPHQISFNVEKGGQALLTTTKTAVPDADGDGHASLTVWPPADLTWTPSVSVYCRNETLATHPESGTMNITVYLPFSFEPNPAISGQTVTFECDLTGEGAGKMASFWVHKPGQVEPITTGQAWANGSGKAVWSYTAKAEWMPEVQVSCRGDELPGMPTSNKLTLSVQ